MSLDLLFHYLLLNMFRMLIHPSSGACDLFVELFHGLYCSGSMCVGVTLWSGWGGVVSGCRLRPLIYEYTPTAPTDCRNITTTWGTNTSFRLLRHRGLMWPLWSILLLERQSESRPSLQQFCRGKTVDSITHYRRINSAWENPSESLPLCNLCSRPASEGPSIKLPSFLDAFHFATYRCCNKIRKRSALYSSVTQPPGLRPVPGPGINTGPREVLLNLSL